MSDNGSGSYVVNSSGQPVVAATPITAAVHNALTADLATALSNRICKDGQTTPTANIPLGGFKLTGVGAATARTDAATIATIQDGTGVYVGTVGGTANAITLTPSPAIAAYATGQKFSFIVAATNTAATTVAISGLAAKSLYNGVTACSGGELRINDLVTVQYDGTKFQVTTYRKSIQTWTPTITCTTPGNLSVSYTTNSGLAEISGNKMTAWFVITTNAFTHTTASGSLTIAGLPFRASAAISVSYGGALSYSGFTKANYSVIVPAVIGTGTSVNLYASGSGQNNASVAITDFPTGGTVILNGSIQYIHDGG